MLIELQIYKICTYNKYFSKILGICTSVIAIITLTVVIIFIYFPVYSACNLQL